MTTPSKTLFQKIFSGEINGEILYKDDLVFAIADISPRAAIHILIIPIEPIPTAADVTSTHEAALGRLFTVAARLAREFGISETGYRLVVNCKDDAEQEVYHLHMHMIGGQKLGPMTTSKPIKLT